MSKPLERWDVPHRRALVGVLALAMLAVPAGRLFQIDLAAMSRARQEAAGLMPVRDILQLIQSTQRHRGLSNGLLAGGEGLSSGRATARDEILAGLKRARESVAALQNPGLDGSIRDVEALSRDLVAAVDDRQVTSENSFQRHSSLIQLELSMVEEIADHSGLSLHQQLAGFGLQKAVLQHLPQVAESLGRLRGQGTRLLTIGQASRDERYSLTVEGGEARNRSNDAAEALRRSGLVAIPGKLTDAGLNASRATEAALRRVESDILAAEHLTAPADAYFLAMTQAIDAQYELIFAGFDVLRAHLDEAYAGARWRLLADAVAALLLSGLGCWLLVIANRARHAQAASDARARAIIDAAPDAVIIVDPGGDVVQANPAARSMFDGHVMPGAPVAALFAPGTRERIVSHLRAVQAGVAQADGTFLEVMVQGGEDDPLETELLCFAVDAGDERQSIVVIRDIRERRNLEMQLRQSQKMEAIGQLTGGIAHDFNNLLAIIICNLDLLEIDLANQPKPLERLNTCLKAALRGADLTRRLLAFSRRQHLEPSRLQLTDAIANVVEMGSRTLGHEISITTSVAPDTPEVMADAAALENVLLNLMVNARDAMPQGGTISIEAAGIDIDGHHPAVRAGELPPGRYASLRVTDTGEGIPADKLEKVFEPFFTTKEVAKGTGLGLAMVYGFVKQSGGNVKIYSEVGVGTTIAIILPIASSDAPRPGVMECTAEHRARPGATALVVDDEPFLQEAAATLLREMGYRVITASDGASALLALERERDVELLVTDVIMPGMNGVVLSQQARSQWPDLRVVFTSGFPADALAQRDSTRVDGPLVAKPFRRQDFARAVGRTMQGKPV